MAVISDVEWLDPDDDVPGNDDLDRAVYRALRDRDPAAALRALERWEADYNALAVSAAPVTVQRVEDVVAEWAADEPDTA